MSEAKERKPVNHVWERMGVDPSPWCQDCKQPTNRAVHLFRARQHIYVCEDCATIREAAPAIRLSEEP